MRAWRRSLPGVLALLGTVGVGACDGEREPPPEPPSLGDPLASLSERQHARFLLGRALFERQLSQEEGLGPLYNAERCSDCHDQPSIGGGGTDFLVRKVTRFHNGTCDLMRGAGGDNIQSRVTSLLASHGVQPEEIPAAATGSVTLAAPPLYGLGLIEAIPESTLAALEDPEDLDGDGISGRLPRAADGRGARFGRKGDAVDVTGFIETALIFELGLTNPGFPEEELRNGTPLPSGVDPAPDPEMDVGGLGLLVDYVRYLAPPAPRYVPAGPVADTVARGKRVFEEIGCAGCHVPELRTGMEVEEALRDRPVRLFSDLLVHDLENGRGDICGGDVSPGEHRTPPLWGLRHRDRYMHDGKAVGIPAAIARHAGEAAAARDAFSRLESGARAALLRFLSIL